MLLCFLVLSCVGLVLFCLVLVYLVLSCVIACSLLLCRLGLSFLVLAFLSCAALSPVDRLHTIIAEGDMDTYTHLLNVEGVGPGCKSQGIVCLCLYVFVSVFASAFVFVFVRVFVRVFVLVLWHVSCVLCLGISWCLLSRVFCLVSCILCLVLW